MKSLLYLALLLGAAGCGFQHGPNWDRPPRVSYEPEAHFSMKVQYFQARLTIDANGEVVRAEVHGEPRGCRGEFLGREVDAEIVALMKQYKFQPAEMGGRPVSSEIFLETNVHCL